jgi:hypothetical protein
MWPAVHRRTFLAAASAVAWRADAERDSVPSKLAELDVAANRIHAKDGGPLGIWRQWAPRAQGQAMKGGHFFPDDTAALVNQFVRS